MSIWQFNRGNWESIPDPIAHESEEQSSDEMKAAGFEQYNSIVSESSGTIEVWRKEDTFYLFLHTLSHSNSVYCPDFPSYLMFLKEFGATFMALEEISSKTHATWDAEEDDSEEELPTCDERRAAELVVDFTKRKGH